MKGKLLAALLGAGVAGGSGFGLSKAVEALPRGAARDGAEAYLLEPGRELAERLGDSRALRKARKRAAAELEDAAQRLEDAGVAEADRVAALYTTGAWAGLGFLVCLIGALAFGASSVGSALAMGLKASLALLLLQGAAACAVVFFLKS